MVVELVAGRIISRHLGSSIYTWTSVIGVILGGLALGNFIGGWIADRYPARRSLSWLFLLSSITSVVIIVSNNLVGEASWLWELAWPLRVATHVALVFFLPAALLGTIGPIVAKHALGLGSAPGRTIGNVYAWGVLGSIAGTFTTGFWLVSVLGTSAIIWSVAAILALVGLCYTPRSIRSWGWSGAVGCAAFFALSPVGWARDVGERLDLRERVSAELIYVDESRYAHIEVRRLSEQPDIRGLYIDKLLHSQWTVGDLNQLHYGYLKIFSALTEQRFGLQQPLRNLTIGGGGYVFPRYLNMRWPNAISDVVEIDEAVTTAALEAFGLEPSERMTMHHVDGRVFVNSMARRALQDERFNPYDVLYLDALDDFSVPSQLTTVEFFTKVDSILEEDGLLLMNFIDVIESGRLAGSLLNTLEQIFPHVSLFTSVNVERASGEWRVTFVAAASRQPIEAPTNSSIPFSEMVREISADDADRYRHQESAQLLSDHFAPVKQLLAPVVRAAAQERGAAEALRRALELERQGDHAGYAQYCREALRLDPYMPEAHYNLGLALHREGLLSDAEHHWNRAISTRPTYAEAHFNLGALHYSAADFVRAEHHFGTAIRLSPTLSEAHIALGVVKEAAGRLAEARAHYTEAVRLAPESKENRAHLRRVTQQVTTQARLN
jgi:spermidine synthase